MRVLIIPMAVNQMQIAAADREFQGVSGGKERDKQSRTNREEGERLWIYREAKQTDPFQQESAACSARQKTL